MANRLDLSEELKRVIPNINYYFQPPASTTVKYPCIVYNKTGKDKKFGNDNLYLVKQEYQLMVIDKNPDSDIADRLESHFEYCGINQYYTVDNLNHTTLILYY